MPKTGSTSIQLFLGNHLTDKRFHYIDFGMKESCFGLINIFSENQEGYIHNIIRGLTSEELQILKAEKRKELIQILTRLNTSDITPVLSCELLTVLNLKELKLLKSFFESFGYRIRLIGYLRPIYSYTESAFQQRTKMGKKLPFVGENPTHPYNELLKLEDAFGRESIQWFKFEKEKFPEGCVVRHFFQTIGAEGDFKGVQIKNEGLSLNAVKLQYAFRKYIYDHLPFDQRSLNSHVKLIAKLAEIKGPKLLFHSSVFVPFAEEIAQINQWIGERTSTPFDHDAFIADNQHGVIKSQKDLEVFEPETLQWLAEMIGKPPVSPPTGEEAARKVAAQMHELFLQVGDDGNPKDRLETTDDLPPNSLRQVFKRLLKKLDLFG